MKKVMVFGSFDVLHKGHFFLLNKAQKLGELHIVVALDETIRRVKKQMPHYSQDARVKHLQKRYPAAKVVLGKSKDKLYWVKKIQPDIFVLGYDQSAFVDKLRIYAEKNDCEIDVLPAFKPQRYKSSKVKKSFWRMLRFRLFGR